MNDELEAKLLKAYSISMVWAVAWAILITLVFNANFFVILLLASLGGILGTTIVMLNEDNKKGK